MIHFLMVHGSSPLLEKFDESNFLNSAKLARIWARFIARGSSSPIEVVVTVVVATVVATGTASAGVFMVVVCPA